jgi:fused signal recognition particle receptor
MFNSSQGLFAKLGKTRKSLTDGLRGLFGGKTRLDEADFDDLEDQLVMADMGVEASTRVVGALRDAARREKIVDGDTLRKRLAQELAAILKSVETPLPDPAGRRPYVILMVGVNGVAKTTTVAKLAHFFKQRDFKGHAGGM